LIICIDVTTATAALLANTPAVVAAGKFKVATPDVSAPVFISTIRQKPSYYLAGKHIKVKAFSTSHS
jgi:hypothetical protein